jgi:hypothetical protein
MMPLRQFLPCLIDFRIGNKKKIKEAIIKKKTKEITILHYRRTTKRGQATAIECCPVCGSNELISVPTAARLTGLSRSTLNEWITSQKVHSIKNVDNEVRLCCQSLSTGLGLAIPTKKSMEI